MYKKLKLLIVIYLIFCLSGCAIMPLKKPLPKGSHIAICSTYGKKAKFKNIGTTAFNNTFYEHRLAGLKMNSRIIDNLSYALKRRGYKIINVRSNLPRQDIVKGGFGGFSVTSYGTSYIRAIKDRYKSEYLLLVVPSAYSFGGSGGSSLATLVGYGVFNRSFLGIKNVNIVAGYRVYLVDMMTNKVLVQDYDSVEVSAKSSLWKDKFNQIPQKDLLYITKTLRTKVPESIKKTVIKMLAL